MSESRAGRPASLGHPPAAAVARRAGAEVEQTRLVDADAVNRPGSRRNPATAAPLPSAPAPGPSGAMWMLVALVMGAAIGAVVGTVAALMIFG